MHTSNCRFTHYLAAVLILGTAGFARIEAADLAPTTLKEQGIQLYKKAHYAEALVDLEQARHGLPGDTDAVFFAASCKLELGAAEGARADFTKVLTVIPSWGSAYIGRALAHAALGDAELARADFASGQKLDEPSARAWKAEFEKRVASIGPALTAETQRRLIYALKDGVAQGLKNPELADRALALVKYTLSTRLPGTESPSAFGDLGTFSFNDAKIIDTANPADPRVAAYRGVLARERGEAANALEWFVTARMIAEARARLSGESILRASTVPLHAEAVGFDLNLNLNAGELALQLEQSDRAVDLLSANVALYERIPETERAATLSAALLPRNESTGIAAIETPTADALALWTRVNLGEAYAKLKRYNEAVRDLTWVANFERRESAKTNTPALDAPLRRAMLDLIQVSIARNDFEGAHRWLSLATPRPDATKSDTEAFNALQTQLEREEGRHLAAAAKTADGNGIASAVHRLKTERTLLAEQKRQSEQVLNDPATAESGKQSVLYWEKKLTEVDHKIKLLEAQDAR